MQRDCRIDRINPSCYSPKALVLREGPSSRLEISLRHSWKRFNVGNKMFATTMLVQRNRSRCWMLTDGLCTTGVRRWRTRKIENHLAQLRTRKIENCKKELTTDLFKHGHVIGMYWENIARSMVERANRDAQDLDVPLFCHGCKLLTKGIPEKIKP